MKFSEISPFVRQTLSIDFSDAKCNDSFRLVKASDHRIFYINSGKGKISVSGKCVEIGTGSVILIGSGTEYMWHKNENDPFKFISVNFDYTENHMNRRKSYHPILSEKFSESDVLEKVYFDDCHELNRPIIQKNVPDFRNRFDTLLREYLLGGKYTNELLSSLLKSILISIVRGEESHKNRAENDISVEVIKYIESNFKKPRLDSEIAEMVHFHPVYLNRIFKKSTGVSLHSYIINYRINVAKILLEDSTLPIGTVANLAGFSDATYFSNSFKKAVGLSPSKFRDQHGA